MFVYPLTEGTVSPTSLILNENRSNLDDTEKGFPPTWSLSEKVSTFASGSSETSAPNSTRIPTTLEKFFADANSSADFPVEVLKNEERENGETTFARNWRRRKPLKVLKTINKLRELH